MCHQGHFPGKVWVLFWKEGYLILDAVRLLVVKVLLNVLGIDHSHNGIEQQAVCQKVLHEGINIEWRADYDVLKSP